MYNTHYVVVILYVIKTRGNMNYYDLYNSIYEHIVLMSSQIFSYCDLLNSIIIFYIFLMHVLLNFLLCSVDFLFQLLLKQLNLTT